MAGYPTFTSIPRVDGLSTDPKGMGRHRYYGPIPHRSGAEETITGRYGLF